MPLPALFVGRWVLAEQPEILMQWFAVIGLFSVALALNAVKLPLVLCWSKQHNVTDIWAPCPMSQHNTVENSTLD